MNFPEYKYRNSELISTQKYLYDLVLNVLKEQGSLKVLDLGCGNGSFTRMIAETGHEVVGVDASISGIEYAQKVCSNGKFICSSIYDLKDKRLYGSFDVVIACEIMEHLEYPRELIRTAKKCLKPEGGEIILTTPYHGYLKNLLLSLTNKWDTHFSVLWDGGHIKFFSKRTLKMMLREEGLERVKFKFAGRIPYLWKTMICLISVQEQKNKSTEQRVI